MKVEKAKIGDVPQMHRLINCFAERGEMLPRALSEIYEAIRDYFVVKENNQIVGCVALHVNWADLAEIKSLAVSEERQGQGVGRALVRSCLDEAGVIGIASVFCLTYKPEFFVKSGFQRAEKMDLPRKVWNECYRCPKFPDCDEVAVIYRFPSSEAGKSTP
ncbi:MAG: N-acetyltransferase [Dehalococcoidia bacterium]|nr:N-acetyltransferase [Dehalococcoidia bacterium]